MASKGQKFNKYSNNLKEEVLNLYLNGVSSWYLERKYNISYKTIQNWGRKIKHQNYILTKALKEEDLKNLN